jgi:hypothetical protein
MKNRIFASAIALIAFSAAANAQVSATATAEATIVAPITITKDVDMNFGNVAVSAAAGTVVLNPATAARTNTGGVTLPNIAGTVAPAEFSVTGNGDYTYAISLPVNAIQIVNGINTMVVDNFTSFPDATGQLVNGSQVVRVGATLFVDGNQAAGHYISDANGFQVTVNYN